MNVDKLTELVLVLVTVLSLADVTDLPLVIMPVDVADVNSLFDAVLVDVTGMTDSSSPTEVADSVPVIMLVDEADLDDVSSTLDTALVGVSVVMEVTERELVLVTIFKDISSLLDPPLSVAVTDGTGVSSTDVVLVTATVLEMIDSVSISVLIGVADAIPLLDVVLVDVAAALEGMTESEDVNSLLVSALVDVTDVANGTDDSSLLDNVLVTVTVLIEATDSVPFTMFADIVDVIS